jgi:hypothetical protein
MLTKPRGHYFARRPSAYHDCIKAFPGHGGRRYPGFRRRPNSPTAAFASCRGG